MYKLPRGTADILPEEQRYWRHVEGRAAGFCQLYGYQRIDTPVFEDARLFIRSIGEGTDIVEKEMYTFDDRSGDKMTLRPEGTAPVCRAYIEHGMHNLPQPVRLYYIAPIFRYERPQAGRYRQHQQFGVEAIGDAAPALDAEVIEMVWQFFLGLGLTGISLQLNSIGCPACRPGYLESLKRYYSEHVALLCPECKTRLVRNPLRLLDCKKPECQKIALLAPRSIDYLCSDCQSHFGLLGRYLGLLGVPFEVNHRLVRGLDYYTRTVFEVQPGEGGAQSALGGGGRYDGLIEQLGGKPTPAVGFAAGIERIILNLKSQGISVPPLAKPSVFVAYIGDEAKEKALEVTATLRRAGMGAIKASADRSLKAQLRQAHSLGTPHAIIIGDEEVREGTVVLRDMVKGEQRKLGAENLVEILKRESAGV